MLHSVKSWKRYRPSIFTPFDEETRRIDWGGLEANIEFLLANGTEVIVPCGNTGGFMR